mmetsp:Transcript_107473/g.302443  ORF Transcript_107473/g.302443 Transcript_107473/m.302443 type:complete len:397 (-) Transcript_107473:19-1209(-)
MGCLTGRRRHRLTLPRAEACGGRARLFGVAASTACAVSFRGFAPAHTPAPCGAASPRRAAALRIAAGGLATGVGVTTADGAVTAGRQQLSQVVATAGSALERTSLRDYEDMRDDAERTSQYAEAIRRRIAGEAGQLSAVDIGTGPFALLAIIAARAGARRVYAIEKRSWAAAMARKAVTDAGLEDQVQIIEGDSTQVVLPERVDFVVSELIGNIALAEGVVDIIRDARSRFLAPRKAGGRAQMIPARCQTLVAPIAYANHDLLQAKGADFLQPFRLYSESTDLRFLAPPQVLEDFDYSGASGHSGLSEVGELAFGLSRQIATDAGGLSGIALWPRVVLDDESTIDIQGRRSHWTYVVVLLSPHPVPLSAPSVLELKSRADLSALPYRYTFDASLSA